MPRFSPAWLLGLLVAFFSASAQTPNLTGNIDRPLRYKPEGQDFVARNGGELFNRPLYGGNTAFRVDGGDRPEFLLYLPGRGGNLRFGLRTPSGLKWLQDAAATTVRYRPGSLVYEIEHAAREGTVRVELTAIALAEREGVIIKVDAIAAPENAELLWAFGGVTGVRGRRDGDIGTEAVPISEYFQFKPEFCQGNTFRVEGNRFVLSSKPATIAGVASKPCEIMVADGAAWADPDRLFSSPTLSEPVNPIVIGRMPLRPGKAMFLSLERVARGGDDKGELADYLEVKGEESALVNGPKSSPQAGWEFAAEHLPEVFGRAEQHFRNLRNQVIVETPDPFINAAAAALSVAADAVWDEPQGVVMHGAIAWRSKLLGWRGPYAMDALGWHDRARRHLTYWAGRQNTAALPERQPGPDEKSNLARSEAALHSNGDISNSHYDMNLVYIDALFRHLMWTGDLDFARSVWPVIERHLAWERRCFRREFRTTTGEMLPLYEAYAAIWASDDLQYHGGGVAHASAYNFYHNKMAARLARLLGQDSTLYENEAKLIARGMRELLWMPDKGMFAEFKDYLGLQRVHPSAALWSFYHVIDSELATPSEAWRMTGYVDRELPHIPVRGAGVPAGLHVLSSSNWMPYTWSINNVVMGEVMHTALGYWQTGRPEEAFRLTKAALMASMYMGISPGNVGSLNYLDVYRRESQRDFADGSGVTSRALVEGLFGLRPDLLAGELLIAPGFPSEWNSARIVHPDVELEFLQDGSNDTYRIRHQFSKVSKIRLRVPARAAQARVTVNGKAVAPQLLELPAPRLEIECAADADLEVAIVWSGSSPRVAPLDSVEWQHAPAERALLVPFDDWKTPLPPAVRLETVDLVPVFNDFVTQIFKNEYRSPRSPFVSLAIPKQGIGAWAGFVDATAEIDDRGLRALAARGNGAFRMPNGVRFLTPSEGKNIIYTSLWDNYPSEAVVPLKGRAKHLYLLMAGSTNWMQSRIDNGEVVVNYTDGSTTRLALENPTTWWPIEQDYFIDDYQFQRSGPLPPRIDLRTGTIRLLDENAFKGKGREIPGGAATALNLALDPEKELESLTLRTLSNEVVIGLMSATLVR